MKNLKQIIIGIFTSVLLLASTGANATPVDAKLALVLDASRSIDTNEFRSQMEGYIAAFDNAEVINRISSTTNGILVELFFYADNAVNMGFQVVLTDAASSMAFSDAIEVALNVNGMGTDPRPESLGNRTNIAAAMLLANGWLTDESEYTSERLIMDVSGDGFQNIELDGDGNLTEAQGVPLVVAQREAATDAGILVNGLAVDESAITDPFTNGCVGPGGYYVQHVINNDICVQSAGFASGDFEGAVIDKLLQETVPEPATLALLGLGLVGFSLKKRKSA